MSLITILVVLAGAASSGEASALPPLQIPGAQVALYRHGFYKGPIDGIAGPMTRRATRRFQRSNGLEADGIVGRRTRAAFGRFGGPLFGSRLLQRGKAGFDVSVLQFLLARRGFSPPSLDGDFGPVTERLVRRFQRSRGLSPDGIVGRQTSAALTRGTPRAALIPQSSERALRASRPAIEASLASWAAHYGVSLDLVRALAWQESGFQNHVRSRAGAVGVMQVIPETRAFVEEVLLGHAVPRTMDGNVRLGVAYLHHLLHRFGMNVRLAVAAYYAGPAAVLSGGLSRPAHHFVANVLALRGRV
ncbi:MAG TPA: peptidoglycan-binding protein [Gaiellaceae bacterium]|nr:peptidoglycan-binding protein [Gaiellaceae bacterium]